MRFTQYYLDCLSQASYLVADDRTGRAVVVDPRRDVAEYVADAAAEGLTIVGVVNTHFHADFVAGHLEMAAATGAWIGYGDRADPEYQIRRLADGERIDLGDGVGVELEVLHTPGHTPESISIVVREHPADQVAYGVLTGDTLFIGDVGRPDLLASTGVTAEDMAADLYSSVHHRLLALPDAVRVFPAHGAGSSCGKNLSEERQSTIGEQRSGNYACQPMTEAEFVALVTAEQSAAPGYFAYDAVLNQRDHALAPEATAVPVLTAVGPATAGATLLDVRPTDDFARGHVRGSISVPLDGRFAETVGSLVPPDTLVVVLAPAGSAGEAVTRLSRVGFDSVLGVVDDVAALLAADPASAATAERLDPAQLERRVAEQQPLVLDVRRPGERAEGHLPGSAHIPLSELRDRRAEVPDDRPVVVYCAGGWRSSVAASYLRATGATQVSDLVGGFGAWESRELPASV